eukprot:CAMPEP_0194401906 /NCGR_PEP_ID=MMETSP0176-20130528/592_1 /TAXON_ID=216777 /ORGANISM="Proboscia alata, Strain PI-D3" /LENGTH=187 /DNA_ID=CAMNT_0039198917 /DNA_START=223 /DNA_END=786 /DNA_ORIENTATION=+
MDQCAGIDIGFDGSDYHSSSGKIYRECSDGTKVTQNEGSSFPGNSTRKTPVTKRRKLHVSFGNIEVREYSQTLVDHPGATYGPSIGLSWDHVSAKTLDIEAHECYRIFHTPRRVGNALAMTHCVRRQFLQNELNISREEIEKACSEAERIQKQRLSSRARIPLEPMDVVIESLKRKVARVVRRTLNQ